MYIGIKIADSTNSANVQQIWIKTVHLSIGYFLYDSLNQSLFVSLCFAIFIHSHFIFCAVNTPDLHSRMPGYELK